METKAISGYFRTKLDRVRNFDSLRFRTIRASFWTIGGYGINQVLRLGGNLILTRLLFPEAFGLMAIVQSVMAGLAMFSDIGVEASIIQNKRGHETAFINTAWTVQVIQGVMIWLLLCALAIPISVFYAQPMLARLMPIVGLGAVVGGFTSTNVALSTRSLALKRRIIMEVGSYAAGLLVMLVWARLSHSIWALVAGGLVGAVLKMVISHTLLTGTKNRLTFEKESFRELFGFGQWVLVSSVITFVAGEGNKLLVGGFLGVKLLAFFTLASTMSLLFWQIIGQLNGYVLFPAYSEVVRNRPEKLKEVSSRTRLYLLVPAWAVAVFFVFFGDRFMGLLYDERYAESGHMLQILSMGQLVGVVGGSYIGLFWARGLIKLSTVMLTVQVTIQILGMVIGNYLWGAQGVILSVAALGWLLYPATAYVHHRIGLWQPKTDMPFLLLSVLVVALKFNVLYGHA